MAADRGLAGGGPAGTRQALTHSQAEREHLAVTDTNTNLPGGHYQQHTEHVLCLKARKQLSEDGELVAITY